MWYFMTLWHNDCTFLQDSFESYLCVYSHFNFLLISWRIWMGLDDYGYTVCVYHSFLNDDCCSRCCLWNLSVMCDVFFFYCMFKTYWLSNYECSWRSWTLTLTHVLSSSQWISYPSGPWRECHTCHLLHGERTGQPGPVQTCQLQPLWVTNYFLL